MRILGTRLTPEEQRKRFEEQQTKYAACVAARRGHTGDWRGAAITGLRRYAERFTAAGDPDTGARLKGFADRAEALLKTETEAKTAAHAERPDFISDAVRTAAAELRKKLPVAFPSDEDALVFCRRLSFVEAAVKATAAADAAFKHSKAAAKAKKELQELMERAADLAVGGTDSAKAVQELVACGR